MKTLELAYRIESGRADYAPERDVWLAKACFLLNIMRFTGRETVAREILKVPEHKARTALLICMLRQVAKVDPEIADKIIRKAHTELILTYVRTLVSRFLYLKEGEDAVKVTADGVPASYFGG